MANASSAPTGARFGVFEVNFASGELRKRGIRIPLQAQPFLILRLLLERQGEVVTRQEMRDRLWPADTFVDFEHSLNSSIKKLRQALGDSAENPRFIETLARRGYRFIAPVEALDGASRREFAPVPAAPPAEIPAVRSLKWIARGTVLAALLLLAAALAFYWFFPESAPRVTRLVQITRSGRVDPWGGIVTDGPRIYFIEREGSHWNLMQTSISGGEAQKVAVPFSNMRLLDVSPDTTEFLAASFERRESDLPIWILPAQGGAPRRVGDLVASLALWTPDGRRILAIGRRELFTVEPDGSNRRSFWIAPGEVVSAGWSPDGRWLRFSVADPARDKRAIWEISREGTRPHPLLAGWNEPPAECCGTWTPDGRFFIFSAAHSEKTNLWTLWAIREKARILRRVRREPYPLTREPNLPFVTAAARSRNRVFYFGGEALIHLERYDRSSERYVSFLEAERAIEATFSRDGGRVAYVSDASNTLWRSRADGSERLQLTFPPFVAGQPRWSPDGKWIAFDGYRTGEVQNIYVVSADGGAPRPILPGGEESRFCPDWSPDGGLLAFHIESDSPEARARTGVFVLDRKSGGLTKLRGSEGLAQPRWSPEGRLAALSADQRRVLLYDSRTETWKELASGVVFVGLAWSADGGSVLFQDLLAEGEPIFRLRIADGFRERIPACEEPLRAGVQRCAAFNVDAEGRPILQLTRRAADIYALDLE
ncbi:MAG TPA: winged helix-turn-helix domain-containing protein [Thermoanaerobaculia bacterium]